MEEAMNNTIQQISLSGGWTGIVYYEWDFPGEVIEMWNSLASEYGDKGIFLSYDWFKNWWSAFGKEQDLLVVILKKSGIVKAIFPCCIRSASLENKQGKCVATLTNPHTCYFDFIISPDVRKEALSFFITLIQQTQPVLPIYLDFLPVAGQNITTFNSVLRNDRIPFYQSNKPCSPWLNVSGDWESYYSNLPGRLKNTIKRNLKKINKNEKIDFEVVESSAAIDEILNVFFEIELNNWKGRQGTAIKCQPQVEGFYRLLGHWAMEQNSLLIFILRIGGVAVAANFCLRSGQTVFLLKPGYHDSYKHLSPGNLLHEEMVKYMFRSHSILYYDLLAGCDPWKMEWTSQTQQTTWLKIYPKSLWGWGYYLTHDAWKGALKQSATVISFKNWLEQKGLR